VPLRRLACVHTLRGCPTALYNGLPFPHLEAFPSPPKKFRHFHLPNSFRHNLYWQATLLAGHLSYLMMMYRRISFFFSFLPSPYFPFSLHFYTHDDTPRTIYFPFLFFFDTKKICIYLHFFFRISHCSFLARSGLKTNR